MGVIIKDIPNEPNDNLQNNINRVLQNWKFIFLGLTTLVIIVLTIVLIITFVRKPYEYLDDGYEYYRLRNRTIENTKDIISTTAGYEYVLGAPKDANEFTTTTAPSSAAKMYYPVETGYRSAEDPKLLNRVLNEENNNTISSSPAVGPRISIKTLNNKSNQVEEEEHRAGKLPSTINSEFFDKTLNLTHKGIVEINNLNGDMNFTTAAITSTTGSSVSIKTEVSAKPTLHVLLGAGKDNNDNDQYLQQDTHTGKSGLRKSTFDEIMDDFDSIDSDIEPFNDDLDSIDNDIDSLTDFDSPLIDFEVEENPHPIEEFKPFDWPVPTPVPSPIVPKGTSLIRGILSAANLMLSGIAEKIRNFNFHLFW